MVMRAASQHHCKELYVTHRPPPPPPPPPPPTAWCVCPWRGVDAASHWSLITHRRDDVLVYIYSGGGGEGVRGKEGGKVLEKKIML